MSRPRRIGHKPSNAWPEEVNEFMKANCIDCSYAEAVELMAKAFPDFPITATQVKGFRSRNRLWGPKGRGCFKKGQIPHNKGTHPPTVGRMAETQFKKGHKPANWRPIGSIRVQSDGYAWIKVNDIPYGGTKQNWVQLSRYNYEKKYGPQPKEYIFLHKDGNMLNDDPGNLMPMTKQEVCRMNQNFRMTDNAEINESMAISGKLINKVHELRKAKKNVEDD